jgi:AbrB family looped-hinge helix DNA binding protein
LIKLVILGILVLQVIHFILIGGLIVKNHKGKYAWTVKVGEKGQIVIPKQARDIFDIKPGDTLIILGDEQQGIAIPPKNTITKLVTTLFDGTMPQKGDEE